MSENISSNLQQQAVVNLSQDSFESFSSFKKPDNRMVIKRDGRSEKINFRHIHDRIETLAKKF